MRHIFEEYGRTVVVVVASLCVFALLFTGLHFFDVLGDAASVDSTISHEQGQGALNDVVSREKPTADFTGVSAHVYKNIVFRPLDGVVFKDADGVTIEAVVTSIMYYDAAGVGTELVGYYNSDEDVIILNKSHYTGTHQKCAASEFSANGEGQLTARDEAAYHRPGKVIVTYKATDSENQVAVVRHVFIVDDKTA